MEEGDGEKGRSGPSSIVIPYGEPFHPSDKVGSPWVSFCSFWYLHFLYEESQLLQACALCIFFLIPFFFCIFFCS